MVRRNIVNSAAALCGLFLASACGEKNGKPDILDAAALFDEHEALFQSIRAAYPGPFEDFTRIPARDPADASKLDADFLSFLREEIPVQFLDFFPIGETGKDEIDVVLWRYNEGSRWNTVRLIYFSTPMTFAEGPETMHAFETCDEEAREWLQNRRGVSELFCRINDHWHAYQKVE